MFFPRCSNLFPHLMASQSQYVFKTALYISLTISGAISMEKVLSAANYQGQARQRVVLACEYSGSGFIWLSHVIWDRVVKDCSLKQHTPPWTVSLLSHSGLSYNVCICIAFHWIMFDPNLDASIVKIFSDLCSVNESSSFTSLP